MHPTEPSSTSPVRRSIAYTHDQRAPFRLRALAAGLALAALTLTASAAELKLVEVASGGRTYFNESTPIVDGRAIVSAELEGDEVTHLFSVPIDGSPIIQLSESPSELPSEPGAFFFAELLDVSTDGSLILYAVHRPEGTSLHSVPSAGPATASVRLDLEVPWVLRSAFISGDNQRAVYEARLESENESGIYSVPIDGPAGATVRLDGPQLSNQVDGFTLTPDGMTALYVANQDASQPERELYAVPVDGSEAPRLLSLRGRVQSSLAVSETHVVYHRQGALYGTPLTGPASATTQLVRSDPTGSVLSTRFKLAENGQTLLYRFREDGRDRLYRAPLDGPAGAAVAITPPDHDLLDYQVVADHTVVYRSIRPDGRKELYSVPLAGPSSEAVKLNPEFAIENADTNAYRVSADGSRVVFHARLETQGQGELWSTPIEGPASASIKLNPEMPPDREVFDDFVLSPDGQYVAYRADLEENDTFELYRISVDGPQGSGIKLNGPLASNGDVCNSSTRDCFQFAPDSRRVLYEAEVVERQQIELFIADDGQAAAAFASAPDVVFENSTVELIIDLGAPSVLSVALEVAQTGGTASATDYALISTVVIDPGQTIAIVPVEILADQERDAGETLELSLTDVQNVGVGLPFTVAFTIRPEGEIFVSGFE